MNISVKYYGLLAEITDCNEEQLEFAGLTVSELREDIYKKHSGLKKVEFQVAQDNNMVSNETIISSNEISLLPPFAGG